VLLPVEHLRTALRCNDSHRALVEIVPGRDEQLERWRRLSAMRTATPSLGPSLDQAVSNQEDHPEDEDDLDYFSDEPTHQAKIQAMKAIRNQMTLKPK